MAENRLPSETNDAVDDDRVSAIVINSAETPSELPMATATSIEMAASTTVNMNIPDGDERPAPAKRMRLNFTARSEVRLLKTVSNIADNEPRAAGDAADKEEISVVGEDTELGRRTVAHHTIPLIDNNVWYSSRLTQVAITDNVGGVSSSELNITTTEQHSTLFDRARNALREEALAARDGTALDAAPLVPLLMRNRVPEGFETDERLDTSLRPDEPAAADYDSFPIHMYGLAMLRGMGWSEGQPIGKSGKTATALKIPELRPKGLGLGADKSAANRLAAADVAAGEDGKRAPLSLSVGCCVRITNGPHRESYGKVESLDADNARALVRLAIGGSVASISQYSLSVVDKKEYDRDAKCINKAKYDKYKSKQERSDAGLAPSTSTSAADPLGVEQISLHSKRSPKTVNGIKMENGTGGNIANGGGGRDRRPWIRPDLRVRIIDDKFMKGKYYNEKVTIVDVPVAGECMCRTDNGTLIHDVHQSSLETLIPRGDPPLYVTVVRGKYNGDVGEIVAKEKRSQMASVRLFRDNKIHSVHFDDICHFVGEITKYED